jgi:hypothetical protein
VGTDWAAAVQTRASVRMRARMRCGNILLSDAGRGLLVWGRVVHSWGAPKEGLAQEPAATLF